MNKECLICGARLEYLEKDETMECAICHRIIDLALWIEQVHWVKQALDLVLDPVNVFTQFNIVPLVLQHPYGMFARDGSTQF